MNYKESIEYLLTRLPMFSRIGPAAFKKDLTNILALSNYLGNPHTKFKSVHVGGTNGKGSTSHMLAAVFQAAGYKTGLYTSPHLKDFRERIKINGELVSESFVTQFVERMLPLVEKVEPSFFEITVAMAFDYFATQQVDIAIVEVGLGGRLDSTNIIEPEISVITNISYDHMNMLGDTLEKIAFEKAGIVKKNGILVVGEYQGSTHQVFEKQCVVMGSTLHFADKKRLVSDWKFEKRNLVAEVMLMNSNEKYYYPLDLTGIYQIKNLITTLESIHQLQQKKWKLDDHHIRSGLRNVKKLTGLHGRWELIRQHPTVILDVGHNEDGIRQITKQIEITDHEELHIVIGLVMDKDIETILSSLPKTAHFYFTKAQIPRAEPEELLAKKAKSLGLVGNAYPDVHAAVQEALHHANIKDLVIVCGSVFVVGEVEMNDVKQLSK
ncbi:MAG: bifunctional folylpolyglutamate synthase/dihydrofolate synthase [Chitinophagales bacterium]